MKTFLPLLLGAGVLASVALAQTGAPVAITESATDFTLANGVMTARVLKRNGGLASLKFRDAEMLNDKSGHPGANGAPAARRQIDWQIDARHYQFWARGDERGNFSIPHVPAGAYTLRALADGVLGEFTQCEVVVQAGQPLDNGVIYDCLRLELDESVGERER